MAKRHGVGPPKSRSVPFHRLAAPERRPSGTRHCGKLQRPVQTGGQPYGDIRSSRHHYSTTTEKRSVPRERKMKEGNLQQSRVFDCGTQWFQRKQTDWPTPIFFQPRQWMSCGERLERASVHDPGQTLPPKARHARAARGEEMTENLRAENVRGGCPQRASENFPSIAAAGATVTSGPVPAIGGSDPALAQIPDGSPVGGRAAASAHAIASAATHKTTHRKRAPEPRLTHSNNFGSRRRHRRQA